jgi:hypothetical protein
MILKKGKKNKCNHKGHLKKFSRKCWESVGINQWPLTQKCNLNNIFHEHKGHFATGKRALLKTWGGGGLAPWPPGSYAPATIVFCNENAKLSLMTVLALTYVIDFCDR